MVAHEGTFYFPHRSLVDLYFFTHFIDYHEAEDSMFSEIYLDLCLRVLILTDLCGTALRDLIPLLIQ